MAMRYVYIYIYIYISHISDVDYDSNYHISEFYSLYILYT